MIFNPHFNDINDILLFFCGQFPTLCDLVPPKKACPAACCSCVLSDKHRMTFVGRLFSVTERMGRSQSFGNENCSMFADCRKTLLFYHFPFTSPQMEFPAKAAFRKCLQLKIYYTSIVHCMNNFISVFSSFYADLLMHSVFRPHRG